MYYIYAQKETNSRFTIQLERQTEKIQVVVEPNINQQTQPL